MSNTPKSPLWPYWWSEGDRDTGLAADSTPDAIESAELFESAWKAGQAPDIEQFLGDSAGSDRAALLRRLIRVELEHRYGKGEAPRIEGYLARWPELSAPEPGLYELVHSECVLRQRRGDPVSLGELTRRFPQLDPERLSVENQAVLETMASGP